MSAVVVFPVGRHVRERRNTAVLERRRPWSAILSTSIRRWTPSARLSMLSDAQCDCRSDCCTQSSSSYSSRRASHAGEHAVCGGFGIRRLEAGSVMLCQPPPNKQLQRTVTRRRGRAASASFHYALAARWIAQRAAAELRRYATLMRPLLLATVLAFIAARAVKADEDSSDAFVHVAPVRDRTLR